MRFIKGINKVASKLPAMNNPNDMRLILGSEVRDPSKRLCKDPQCQQLDDYTSLMVTREAVQRNFLRNHLRVHAVMS